MCNLSQGIVDDTKVEIINKYVMKISFSLEQIRLATKKSNCKRLEKIIKENKSVIGNK
mgnify:CR=1 FL=1